MVLPLQHGFWNPPNSRNCAIICIVRCGKVEMIRLWNAYPRNNAHCKSTNSNNKVNHERSDCERSVLLQSNYPLDHRNKSCNWPFIRRAMQFWPMNGDHGGVCVSCVCVCVCSVRLPSPTYFGNYIFIARKQVNNSRNRPSEHLDKSNYALQMTNVALKTIAKKSSLFCMNFSR